MSESSKKSSVSEMPHLRVRADMIDGRFELSDESVKFMAQAREVLGQAGEDLLAAAPAHTDVGRLTAALDALQHAKNLFCDAVIIGNESENRKKRARTDE